MNHLKLAMWKGNCVRYDHNDPNLIEDVMKEQVQLLNTMFQVLCAM